MNEDKRFYTFVFAPTASSTLRKFNIHHNVLFAILGLAVVGMLTVGYGVYSIAQYAMVVAKLNIQDRQIRQLREENQEAKNKSSQLQTRLAALDTTQRKLAESSGISRPAELNNEIGQGGPNGALDNLSQIAQAAASLESELLQIKDVFDRTQVKLASTPSGWPVRGYITDGFGNRRNPFGGGYESHAGLDIATNHGTAIEATADGIVIFAGPHGGYGNVVVIDHGYGITTRYAHMSKLDVNIGEHVTRGKQVGAVGSTGRSTAPHCHYEVRLHDRPVNPLNYLSVGRS
ncbi:MAG: peptidoglycan DD-metalloendopeptidase family protein [Blastocatellia bacterium]